MVDDLELIVIDSWESDHILPQEVSLFQADSIPRSMHTSAKRFMRICSCPSECVVTTTSSTNKKSLTRISTMGYRG
jgi:hypothetical protein